MRPFSTLVLLAAATVATPALANSDCAPHSVTVAAPKAAADHGVIVPGYDRPPAAAPVPLAELAADSPWFSRFAAAADQLLAAFRSGDVGRWQPLLGGRWLDEGDRRAVAALLADQCGAFAPLMDASTPPARRILGWTVPASYSQAERAEIAGRPEAEALVCWSAKSDAGMVWPRIAAEADNAAGRPYGCARLVYSLRAGRATWRAFVETPPGMAD